VFTRALSLKHDRLGSDKPLAGQSWGLLFFKNSTRTRVSFEVGLHELGAHPVVLDVSRTQIARSESVADTARVLSRYLHGLIVRCHGHDVVETFAAQGSIPVVNALTDFLHPCQVFADYFTIAEKRTAGCAQPTGKDLLDALRGLKLAFFGDTNSNMANSLALAGAHFGAEVVLCGPERWAPGEAIRSLMGEAGLGEPNFTTDPDAAADGADVIYTDVWVSMGTEEGASERAAAFRPYAVDAALMARAKPGAWFMHCLPAHPGEEVTQAVLDSEASIIFDQAENRLHVQKAILTELTA